MACFISAGHNPKGIRIDNGAVGCGYKEAELTVEFRDLVVNYIKSKYNDIKIITDKDDETLAQYLKRIQPGTGSVVVEFHFDAAPVINGRVASGTTSIVGTNSTDKDNELASELVNITSDVLRIRNRGVISESQSHRGRLGLMRKQGIVTLLEIAFITNENDMKQYQLNKNELAVKIGDIIVKYDRMY